MVFPAGGSVTATTHHRRHIRGLNNSWALRMRAVSSKEIVHHVSTSINSPARPKTKQNWFWGLLWVES
eukprot:scaffold1063_cov136-Amphora_coffeaeformis.AAC.3